MLLLQTATFKKKLLTISFVRDGLDPCDELLDPGVDARPVQVGATAAAADDADEKRATRRRRRAQVRPQRSPGVTLS